jgi:hypothetical protein
VQDRQYARFPALDEMRNPEQAEARLHAAGDISGCLGLVENGVFACVGGSLVDSNPQALEFHDQLD